MSTAITNEVVVYRATNLVNGKCYIGYTARGLASRRYQHIWKARKGGKLYFHRAIQKHGPENFVFEVMADFVGDDYLARVYECEAIEKYKPEYNLSYGGEGGTLHESARKKIGEANSRRVITDEIRKNISDGQRGSTRSAETRAKMRAAQLGRKHTAETVQKMRTVCGHPVTDEARKKMSVARQGRESPAKGKKWSDEARARMSAARKGKPSPLKGSSLTDEHRQRISAGLLLNPPPTTAKKIAAAKVNAAKAHEAQKKSVVCLTDGRVFDSSNDADRFYGFSVGSVNKVVRAVVSHTHGMRFEYAVKK